MMEVDTINKLIGVGVFGPSLALMGWMMKLFLDYLKHRDRMDLDERKNRQSRKDD